MSNIYFPEEQIGFNELYFVCYMIERTARQIKQHNRYVVEQLGQEGLARQLSIANTIHSLNPEQVVADWIEEYHLTNGNEHLTNTIQRVYASPICDAIDNYNSSAYYEPSYVQTRAFYAGEF